MYVYDACGFAYQYVFFKFVLQIFQEPIAGSDARCSSSPLSQLFPDVPCTESVKIPSTSPFSPPLIRPGQVIFFSKENCDATNQSVIHMFELETRMWRHVNVPKICNTYKIAFCLLYEGCIAVLCLETVKSHCANVAIYKLIDHKEMSSRSWKRIPFTSETLMPIDLSGCQCVQSNRNIVLASICQSSNLWVYVHQYSSQQSWIRLCFSVKTTTLCSYELQSCAILHHTLYCSLSCMERSGQQKVAIYKVDLEFAIKNNDTKSLEIVCNCTYGILQCYLLILSNSCYGYRSIVVNIIANNNNRCKTLEVCLLNDNCTKLFQKNYVFDTKLISTFALPSTCNDDVLIVYYDNVCNEYYLEIFPLSWPKE